MLRIPTLLVVFPTLILLKDNFSTIRINKSLFIIGSLILITLPSLKTILHTPATDFTNSFSLIDKILLRLKQMPFMLLQ